MENDFSTVIVANHDLRRIMSRFWRFGHSWGIFRGLPEMGNTLTWGFEKLSRV
ncbi:hypothetical protein HMPREF0580_0814 [Mobiluncus mulieris ATCC 35239]|uniref:Uncharacterized protein n=1 Tax=Mobiluncus mulieris ATCC 35239 TaxID=871571 RepID=E0QPJ9_9ACTO|nr:hypothetical protein HMPREF0577_1118 [Mobiluncus mulieris ATCC 35243]EFM46512.1 hypothetical protein HMPREF0580_0814 [Mobiluncus mulieris ATCC 35239]